MTLEEHINKWLIEDLEPTLDMMTCKNAILHGARNYASEKVQEQRDIMSRHLNIRNVPKPEI